MRAEAMILGRNTGSHVPLITKIIQGEHDASMLE